MVGAGGNRCARAAIRLRMKMMERRGRCAALLVLLDHGCVVDSSLSHPTKSSGTKSSGTRLLLIAKRVHFAVEVRVLSY